MFPTVNVHIITYYYIFNDMISIEQANPSL